MASKLGSFSAAAKEEADTRPLSFAPSCLAQRALMASWRPCQNVPLQCFVSFVGRPTSRCHCGAVADEPATRAAFGGHSEKGLATAPAAAIFSALVRLTEAPVFGRREAPGDTPSQSMRGGSTSNFPRSCQREPSVLFQSERFSRSSCRHQ